MAENARQVTPAFDLSQYRLSIQNEKMTVKVFWARVVSSETESLLTQYTRHTFFEVQYALEGRIVITVGDNRFTLKESDFIVIPPDTYHQIIDGDETGARFIMAFSLSDKEDILSSHLRTRGASPHRESPALRALLKLILQKGREDSPFCAEVLSSLIEAFLLELCDSLAPTRQAYPDAMRNLSESAERIAAVQKFVRDYHGIGISVTELARRFGISERHLNRIFRSETGETLRDQINHEKLRHMEELIASTDLSFTEISALCDFCDEYAMNKFFKRYNRMRLSDYRRLARTKREKA
ncbi:MAG: helix-turn-helix domain-containing protein [Clostridia bacterium]|nr:helix-turn-helix domain-containing protein [Clostridia bacterium]